MAAFLPPAAGTNKPDFEANLESQVGLAHENHGSAIGSPASRRATNLTLSSMTEHSSHGIHFPPQEKGESVTYVSGTICYRCLGSLTGTWLVVPLGFRKLSQGPKRSVGKPDRRL